MSVIIVIDSQEGDEAMHSLYASIENALRKVEDWSLQDGLLNVCGLIIIAPW